MLKNFRGMVKGVGAYILIAVVILAFAVVGVPQLNNFGRQAAISVGKTDYSMQDIEREFVDLMDLERRQTGAVVTREGAIEQGLLAEAVSILNMQGLYAEESRVLGLTTTDQMLGDFLSQQPGLANEETGRIDARTFTQLAQGLNMSVVQLKRELEQDVIRLQIESGLRAAVTAPSSLAELVALRSSEERTVRTASLSVPPPGEPEEQELASFYASNADQYTVPERREYTLVILDPETIQESITIDENELLLAFQARKARLDTPETRSFSLAQFADMNAAEAALAAVQAGTPLEEVVAGAGTTISTFTDQEKEDLIDQNVADAVFASETPGIVGPVQGDFGVVIASVSAITPAIEAKLEDIRDELEAELAREDVNRTFFELNEAIQLAGDRGETLATAAAAIDLPIRTVGPVDADLLTAEGAFEPDVPLAAHRAAFQLAPGEIFEEIELDDGASAFVEVSEILPASPRELESVKEEVTRDFSFEQQRTAILDFIAAFESDIAAGTGFDDAVSARGGTMVTRTLSNFVPDPSVPQGATVDLFTMPIGTVVTSPGTQPGTVFVGMTDTVRFPQNAQLEQTAARVQNQLTTSLSQELFAAYIEAAREDYGAEQNNGAIAANFGVEQ